MRMELFAIDGLPLIKKGDDLAAMICERAELEDHDSVVIASTIVAKAEGAMVQKSDVVPSQRAINIAKRLGKDPVLVQLVLDRSSDVIIEFPLLLVENLNGHVSINAGIDDSNVDTDYLLELPHDPDASAKGIGKRIADLCGRDVSVIITDTNGRAFKIGQTGVAVGVYHMHPIRNWQGEKDLFGKELEITEEAVADELAGAANLLMGEAAGGIPVVIVRGFEYHTKDDVSVKEMYRPDNEDIIRKGLRCLRQSSD
ncbi:F420-0--gamma-glutamyl ligase [Methanococcoides methylutens]|uniref:Coenzyme F420:L-glutamate ligase n=1 Tax=Methanococcoides methylutens TaxID=2226 RepID=A0A099T1W1_METMT|nr:coenzyme F420-0:L-glutamate ligase [Methanococcoides methylutens]KGK99130.1 F420-0--gamma-glutamyl ligase [Methanococcoides methylutens]